VPAGGGRSCPGPSVRPMGDRWSYVSAHPNATALPVAHGRRAASTLLTAAAANPLVQQSNVGQAAAQPGLGRCRPGCGGSGTWRAAGTGRGRRAHTRKGQAASIPRPGPGHTSTRRRRSGRPKAPQHKSARLASV